MATKYKYLDKKILDQINRISRDVINYNRSLPQNVVDALPDNTLFVVTFSMLHEHIAGEPAEPHMRCMLYCGPERERLVLDMEMGLYQKLPEYEVTEKENGAPAVV